MVLSPKKQWLENEAHQGDEPPLPTAAIAPKQKFSSQTLMSG